jgi:hypothetical protein
MAVITTTGTTSCRIPTVRTKLPAGSGDGQRFFPGDDGQDPFEKFGRQAGQLQQVVGQQLSGCADKSTDHILYAGQYNTFNLLTNGERGCPSSMKFIVPTSDAPPYSLTHS